ncbi:MAG: ABC transporter ATP-binding protein/permease [Clostridioides sp.]|jgi:ATP-binding cassette subfamily B protein|nr:ABC transporter ATP-binding protein/permease [Clostridioides sp.]
MIKRFIKYYAPYKKIFYLDLLAAFLYSSCDLLYPMLTRNIINKIVPDRNIKMLVIFSIGLLIIFAAKSALNYFMQYQGHMVGVGMQADMRNEVFTHLQKLPNKYFDDNKSGVTMSKIVNDLMDISELAHHGPEDLFISGVMILGSFFILLNINWILTLIIFSVIPFVIWFAIIKKDKMGVAAMEGRVSIGNVNATLENSIAGMKVTKSFCTEKQELKKFKNTNKTFISAKRKSYKAMAEYYSGMIFYMDFLQWVVLIAGGFFAYYGRINLGDYVGYLLYVSMFIQPLRKLINFTEQYQNGITGFQRFEEIMSQEIQKERKNARELKNIVGKIELNDVSFNYEGKNKVLQNFSLTIEAGKSIALVGPSGGGKTTICNLIPRFYEYDSGDITIDGISVRDITLKSLRKSIGIVQQDVFLFTGTIKDNIICGNPDATDEEIIEAAKKAKIHDFVMSQPEGYDTYIGERGVKLSGGQKQRISIARIFLKNPPIMILDEATSALDNVTEREIQESLEELSKNRTSIIVAHRLSTIKNADMIVVMGENGICEKGTHSELMSIDGVYKKLQTY